MKKYAIAKKYAKLHHKQAGMTLIELTVVLLVLIGLAGLLIPYVAGFVQKTHDSTGDASLAELNNAIQRYQVEHQKFPNNLQNLADATGIYASLTPIANAAAVPGGGVPVATLAGGLTATEITSLGLAGITTVQSLNQTGPSATFDVAANGPITLAATSPVAVVGPGGSTDTALYSTITVPGNLAGAGPVEQQLADTFGMQASNFNSNCYDYVVWGVGSESDMTNKTISSAPVHFSATGAGPDKEYARFAGIFAVQKAINTVAVPVVAPIAGGPVCPSTIQPAQYIGAVQIDLAGHLFGLSHSLGHTYTNMATQ